LSVTGWASSATLAQKVEDLARFDPGNDSAHRRAMKTTAEDLNALTETAIGAGMRVHKGTGGPGLLESAYQECFAYELSLTGVSFRREHPLPLTYGAVKLNCGYRVDFVLEDSVIIEVKAIERLHPIHLAQMLTYLRVADCRVGLIMNFNVRHFPNGIRRVVNDFPEEHPIARGDSPQRSANPQSDVLEE
jgi:GxxExxY protein